jgi:hypothetical protein
VARTSLLGKGHRFAVFTIRRGTIAARVESAAGPREWSSCVGDAAVVGASGLA